MFSKPFKIDAFLSRRLSYTFIVYQSKNSIWSKGFNQFKPEAEDLQLNYGNDGILHAISKTIMLFRTTGQNGMSFSSLAEIIA